MPPTTCGRYRVDARIGSAGIGEVYRGFATRLDRPVVLKVIAERPGGSTRFPRVRRADSPSRPARRSKTAS